MNLKLMKRWLHYLFFCKQDLDIGHGAAGQVAMCSVCKQGWLRPWRTQRWQRISRSEMYDHAERLAA